MHVQHVDRHDFQCPHVRCMKIDLRCAAFLVRLQEPAGAEAPAISGFQSCEPVFWAWRAEIVADIFGKSQKFICHHRTYGMAPLIRSTGITGTVSKKTGHWISRAGRQCAAENVERGVFFHSDCALSSVGPNVGALLRFAMGNGDLERGCHPFHPAPVKVGAS